VQRQLVEEFPGFDSELVGALLEQEDGDEGEELGGRWKGRGREWKERGREKRWVDG
jgi:hypothetical protein